MATSKEVETGEVTGEVLEGIRKATAFINNEVRAHNEKEEELLFPELEKVLPPKGPTFVMREEHRRLWEVLEKVEGTLERLEGDKDGAVIDELVASAQFVVQLLSEHINKENSVLFPMARQLLTPEQMATIADRI
ncbi:MAG: hemerythrin domain-containing protein [Anaerolineae bacterium]